MNTSTKRNNASPTWWPLILACLVVVPLLPLAGAAWGALSLRGEPRSQLARINAVAALGIGLFATLFLQLMLGVPWALQFWLKQKQAMVFRALDRVERGCIRYASRSSPPSFPVAETSWTPKSVSCRPLWNPEKTGEQWRAHPWNAIGFRMEESAYGLQLRYSSDGRTVRLFAKHDFSCAGRPAIWEYRAIIRGTAVPSFFGPIETEENGSTGQ